MGIFFKVQNKHGMMAFNLRDFEDEKKAKMGVVECVKNKLIEPYQVLYEKSGNSHSIGIALPIFISV